MATTRPSLTPTATPIAGLPSTGLHAGLGAGLSVADVRSLFGPPVTRVMLDWDALDAAHAPVTVQVLTGTGLHRLLTPWYLHPRTGREVSYDHPDATPLRAAEVPSHLAGLDPERLARINAIADSCTPHAETWLLPCYALPTFPARTETGPDGPDGPGEEGDLLLLDGNHRIAAHFVHHLHARVLALVVHGPLDPAVLPDLANHARQPATHARQPAAHGRQHAEPRRR